MEAHPGPATNTALLRRSTNLAFDANREKLCKNSRPNEAGRCSLPLVERCQSSNEVDPVWPGRWTFWAAAVASEWIDVLVAWDAEQQHHPLLLLLLLLSRHPLLSQLPSSSGLQSMPQPAMTEIEQLNSAVVGKAHQVHTSQLDSICPL